MTERVLVFPDIMDAGERNDSHDELIAEFKVLRRELVESRLEIPIIFITAYADEEVEVRAR